MIEKIHYISAPLTNIVDDQQGTGKLVDCLIEHAETHGKDPANVYVCEIEATGQVFQTFEGLTEMENQMDYLVHETVRKNSGSAQVGDHRSTDCVENHDRFTELGRLAQGLSNLVNESARLASGLQANCNQLYFIGSADYEVTGPSKKFQNFLTDGKQYQTSVDLIHMGNPEGNMIEVENLVRGALNEVKIIPKVEQHLTLPYIQKIRG